jgi:hypothetical protein
MFIVDLLLLPLGAMILPDPGVQGVFIHAQVTRGLSNGLIRLNRQFDGTPLKFRGLLLRCGLTQRTHLV